MNGYLRRRSDDASRRTCASDNHNIWNAIPFSADLNPDFDTRPKASHIVKNKRLGAALRVAVTQFSRVSLHQMAVHRVAVTVGGVGQIVTHRNCEA